MNKIEKTIIQICLALAIFTTSFDIVGIINIVGFNFRFTQFIILPVFVLYIFHIIKDKKIQPLTGDKWLWLWVLFQGLFIFRSASIKNALGYFLWLIFNILVIYAISYFTDKAYSLKWLIKVYLYSFTFMGGVGLLQIFLYLFGINFYVAQIWSSNLARINGFCYEPSYYSTYMIMGFVSSIYLVEKEDYRFLSKKLLYISTFIITIALFLSSSRMGWLTMYIYAGYRFIEFLYRLIFKKEFIKRALYVCVFLLLAFLIKPIGINLFGDVLHISENTFTAGITNGGSTSLTEAHSSGPRIQGLLDCVEVFKESPILGVSLGGVDPALAKYHGAEYSTLDNGSAMSALGEILAANGIVGLIPFVMFGISLLFSKVKLDNLGMALKIALLFEVFMLCFNQNILRSYTWMHIAIYMTVLSGAFYKEEVNEEE